MYLKCRKDKQILSPELLLIVLSLLLTYKFLFNINPLGTFE